MGAHKEVGEWVGPPERPARNDTVIGQARPCACVRRVGLGAGQMAMGQSLLCDFHILASRFGVNLEVGVGQAE